MKQRPVWLLYVALLLTDGLFSLAWILMMAAQINRIENRPVFPVRRLAVYFCSLLIVQLLVLFQPEFLLPADLKTSKSGLALVFLFSCLLFFSFIVLLMFVDRHVKLKAGIGFGIWDVLSITLLTIVLFSSLIVVQRRINSLVARVS